MTRSDSCPAPKQVLPLTRGSANEHLPSRGVRPAPDHLFSVLPPDLASRAHRESVTPHPPILQMGEPLRAKRKVAHPGLVEKLGLELKYPGSLPGGFPGQRDDFPFHAPYTRPTGPSPGLPHRVSGTDIPTGAPARSFLTGSFPPPRCSEQGAPLQC